MTSAASTLPPFATTRAETPRRRLAAERDAFRPQSIRWPRPILRRGRANS